MAIPTQDQIGATLSGRTPIPTPDQIDFHLAGPQLEQTMGAKTFADFPLPSRATIPQDIQEGIKRMVLFDPNGNIVPKKIQQPFLPNTELRAGAPDPITRIVRALPKPLQSAADGILRDVSSGLFGDERSREMVRQAQEGGMPVDMFTEASTKGIGRGILSLVAPFIARDDTDKMYHLEDKLREAGIDPSRASQIAFYDVYNKTLPQNAKERQDKLVAEQKLSAMNLSPQEKQVLSMAHLGQSAGSAFDVVGFLSAPEKEGLARAIQLAQTGAREEVIPSILSHLAKAGVEKTIAEQYAPLFAKADLPTIQKGIESLHTAVTTTKKTSQLATGATPEADAYIKTWGNYSFDTETEAAQYAKSLAQSEGGTWRAEQLPSGWRAHRIEATTEAAPGLTEEGARAHVTKEYQVLKPKYTAQIAKDYNGADNVISADSAKHIIEGYKGELAPIYHEASSDFAKTLYKEWLTERKGLGNNTVLFTGGATGVGKSSALRTAGQVISDFPIVYDTNLTGTGALAKIKAALDNGYDVVINIVHRDPVTSFVEGVLPRTAKENRVVSIEEHAARHAEFAKDEAGNMPAVTSIEEAFKPYIEDGTLKIAHIDNTGARNQAHFSPLDAIQKFDYNNLNGRLQQATKKALRKGEISQTQADSIARGANRAGTRGRHTAVEGLDHRPRSPSPEHPVARGRVSEFQKVSVGEGTQATRAAQEEAASAASKRAIEDKIPVPAPQHIIAALAEGKDGKTWTSLVRGYLSKAKPNARVHILDYMRTPEYVLEKVGLGRAAAMLHDAQDLARATLKRETLRIEGWQARVKNNPHAARLIFQYLDGQERNVVRDMTDEEHAVAQEIRTYLQEWATRLHLPEDKQISRYITHLFERTAEGLPSETFNDPELMALMQEQPAKSVYNPFLEKRLGKQGYIEDVWRALDAYVKRASRKEAMDPALEELEKQARGLDDLTYQYVTKMTHRINMRPTNIEKLMDSFLTQTPIGYRFTERPTAFLSKKIRQIFYRGTLGLNVSSALRNLTQGVNTYAKLGEKYTAIGYTKLISRMAQRDLGELFDQGILDDAFVQDRNLGVIKKRMQALDKGLFVLFQYAEKINRGAAYFGAKSKAINEGLSEVEAIRYAKRMVRETQFAFGAVDTPVALNDDLVKTLAQLQTYNIKQIEFLARMIHNKEFAGLVRFAAGSTAMLYSIGYLIGMTKEQLLPTIGFGGAPVSSTLLSVPALFSSDDQTRAKAWAQEKRNAATLIPGGAQLRKTYLGATDLMRGRDVTATGKTRYHVGSGDALQALIFGPSSLPQAQQYFDDRTQPGAAAQREWDRLKSVRTQDGAAAAAAAWENLKASNPTLFAQVETRAKDEELGVSDADRKLRNLGVASGERAQAVADAINALDAKADKQALWREYSKKKIITADVAKQVEALLK